jgi:hypothetical protein
LLAREPETTAELASVAPQLNDAAATSSTDMEITDTGVFFPVFRCRRNSNKCRRG